MSEGVVIVGGGQVAAVAARSLRRKKYEGPITIIGEEAHRPYQRPPLSKEYLLREEGAADSLDLLPEKWTEDNDVTVLTGVRATKIEPGPVVLTDDGGRHEAEHVIIATGGTPRRLPGAEGERIHYLRDRDDSDRLAEALESAQSVVIVGGGFIGAEIASSARAKGKDVTVVEAAGMPMQRALGQRLGEVCARLQRDGGVDLQLSTGVESVRDTGSGVEVETTGGTITADLAVVAIGIVPRTDLAEASGIAVNNGILVDDHLRTDLKGVFAAGDVANVDDPRLGARVRVEHFDSASKHAAAIAATITGKPKAVTEPQWFWSDQFGAHIQGVGYPNADDEMVVRGDIDGDFTAFFLHEGRVRAAFTLNRGDDIAVARELVAMEAEVPRELLTDIDKDLFDAMEEIA